MAALTHGPRLGQPRADGFTCWSRFDAPATIKLEVRVAGTAAWAVADTQPTDAAYDETVILTAAGLDAGTKYEYRVLADDAEVASNSTWTMPAKGRFVCYQVSDGHDDNVDGYAAILADYEANYEPSGVPAFIVQIGDLYSLIPPSGPTGEDAAASKGYPQIAAIAPTVARLPVLFMFDDWDWGGNNSNATRLQAFAGVWAEAEQLWNILWRDHARPAPPSFAYTHVVADVPFIVTDQRSQKTFVDPLAMLVHPRGDENPREAGYLLHGDVQGPWLIEQLIEYRRRALVFYISGGTFRGTNTPIATPTGPFTGAEREGAGLFYTGELAHIFREGCARWGYAERRNLVVLSGDDHFHVVWNGDVQEPVRVDDTTGDRPRAGIRAPFYEFKSSLHPNVTPGGALYGPEWELWRRSTGISTFVRWDITSEHAGERVTARATFIDVDTSTAAVGDDGTDADFLFDNGRLVAYSAAEAGEQAYPPENSPEPGPVFGQAFVDDILGTVHTYEDVARDREGRLRRVDDLDEPGRDRLVEDWPIPIEDYDPPLPRGR